MKRFFPILLVTCCLAPLAMALEEAEGVPEKESAGRGELSIELDQFVRDAINEGLLTPTVTRPAEAETDEIDLPLEPQRTEPSQVPVEIDCAAPYALDLADFREFSRYQQVFSFQENASVANGGAGDEEGDLRLAGAYLALGLYSEANMVLKPVTGPKASAYRKLAAMLERRVPADVDYFRQLTECHSEAGIWLAVALLINDQDAGVRQLSENLNGFRNLPFQIKADLVALAVPALDKRDERILAVKLMAEFTEEQVQQTPQLQFAKAVIDLVHSTPGADKTLRSFLNDPAYQEEALSALMRRETPLNDLHEEILLSELMRKFGQTGNDMGLASSLQFALKELSASSHYAPIMELAGKPALQNERAQVEIRRQFVAGLQRDLASDNSLRNLAAINALASDTGILAAAPERADLYRAAATLAVRFGLVSIAKDLAEKDGIDANVIGELAELEFLRNDYQAVYAWARSYPDHASVNLLAARSAIRAGNESALAEFESHLRLDPETILTLIEEDASVGQWMVADQYYQIAATFGDDVLSQRVDRVLAMRRAARDIASGPRRLAVADVSAVLKGAEVSPEQVTGGAH